VPRHNRRIVADNALQRTSHEQVDSWRGTDYVVRSVSSGQAAKSYRCPGCDHEIRPGVAHVVTWPADDLDAGDRRHWHTGCWAARDTRGPTRRA
jgi:hypothetical protein